MANGRSHDHIARPWRRRPATRSEGSPNTRTNLPSSLVLGAAARPADGQRDVCHASRRLSLKSRVNLFHIFHRTTATAAAAVARKLIENQPATVFAGEHRVDHQLVGHRLTMQANRAAHACCSLETRVKWFVFRTTIEPSGGPEMMIKTGQVHDQHPPTNTTINR